MVTFNGDAQKCDTVCDVQSGVGGKNNGVCGFLLLEITAETVLTGAHRHLAFLSFSGWIRRARELQLPCEGHVFVFPPLAAV